MALYTNELAAEAMREKARSEIERAKHMASVDEERRRASFRSEGGRERPHRTVSAEVLQRLTRDELYTHAKEIGLKGRSKMNKKQLAEAVREAW